MKIDVRSAGVDTRQRNKLSATAKASKQHTNQKLTPKKDKPSADQLRGTAPRLKTKPKVIEKNTGGGLMKKTKPDKQHVREAKAENIAARQISTKFPKHVPKAKQTSNKPIEHVTKSAVKPAGQTRLKPCGRKEPKHDIALDSLTSRKTAAPKLAAKQHQPRQVTSKNMQQADDTDDVSKEGVFSKIYNRIAETTRNIKNKIAGGADIPVDDVVETRHGKTQKKQQQQQPRKASGTAKSAPKQQQQAKQRQVAPQAKSLKSSQVKVQAKAASEGHSGMKKKTSP